MDKSVQTTVVGSYPLSPNLSTLMNQYFQQQPIDWKPCIKSAVEDMINAGIYIVSDGQTRDPFVHLFIRRLRGCRIRSRPEIIGPIEYKDQITVTDQKFVKEILPQNHQLKGVITGPYTLAKSSLNLYYDDDQEAAFAFADALQKEVTNLSEHVTMISIDEPWFANEFPSYAQEIISIIVEAASVPITLHVCGNVAHVVENIIEMPVDILSHEFKAQPALFDCFNEYSFKQKLCVGAVRSDDTELESVEEIVNHIKTARQLFGDKVRQIAPDCGQRTLPRKCAYEKLKNLVEAGRRINAEIGS